jgi:hypothetical protein
MQEEPIWNSTAPLMGRNKGLPIIGLQMHLKVWKDEAAHE